VGGEQLVFAEVEPVPAGAGDQAITGFLAGGAGADRGEVSTRLVTSIITTGNP
jgi:hypothetical protein